MAEGTAPDWRPDASLQALKLRADILAEVRRFFSERQVLEVDTPLISRHTVTDRFMQSFAVPGFFSRQPASTGYLQTSPEFAMKRLLADGSGDIYQICKAFRRDESGSRHNPEFTMLEWYRVGFDHHELMDEVCDLLTTITGIRSRANWTYHEAFRHYLETDIGQATTADLQALANRELGDVPADMSRDDSLGLLFAEAIEPRLAPDVITCVHDFPASQAALARINPDNPEVACRFEVFAGGMELANGFHELTDPREQAARFEADNRSREASGQPVITPDNRLLAALEAGLPDCAGVALGLDRLIMLAASAGRIDQVLAFGAGRA